MLDIKETEVTIKSESDSEGIITVEPLNQGYGSTLGSSILVTNGSGYHIRQN